MRSRPSPLLRGHRRAPEAVAEGALAKRLPGRGRRRRRTCSSRLLCLSRASLSRNDSAARLLSLTANSTGRCVRRPCLQTFVEMPDLLLDPLALRDVSEGDDGPDQQIAVLPDRVVVYSTGMAVPSCASRPRRSTCGPRRPRRPRRSGSPPRITGAVGVRVVISCMDRPTSSSGW